MLLNTKVFGEVVVDDDRIISFERGIIGFPDLKRFAIMHNKERENARVAWLVSIDEPAFALPVMDPLVVISEYNPEVDDELIKPLGEMGEDDLLVLVTVSVPKDVKDMTVNLRAPIIINADKRKGCQIILESSEYEIKFPVYDILQKIKKEEGC